MTRRAHAARIVAACAFLVSVAATAACVPPRAAPSGTVVPAPTTPAAPLGWTEHAIEASGVVLALPDTWVGFDEAALDDPVVRASLERDYTGARSLFASLDAGGRRARVVFVAVDERARGTGSFAPSVAIISVEPALPPLLLDLGADFVLQARERTLAIESGIRRARVATPLGSAARISFEHRVGGGTGEPGDRIAQDGALVTTGATSFFLSLNVDPGSTSATTPTLEAILGSLRAGP
jgi:hypothetical protein